MGMPALEQLLSHVYGSAVDNGGWAAFCETWNGYSGAKVLLFGQPPSNTLVCRGGKVKGSLCWCGLGKFPKKVPGTANTWQCR